VKAPYLLTFSFIASAGGTSVPYRIQTRFHFFTFPTTIFPLLHFFFWKWFNKRNGGAFQYRFVPCMHTQLTHIECGDIEWMLLWLWRSKVCSCYYFQELRESFSKDRKFKRFSPYWTYMRWLLRTFIFIKTDESRWVYIVFGVFIHALFTRKLYNIMEHEMSYEWTIKVLL